MNASLLALDPVTRLLRVVVFQHTPASLSRTVRPRMGGSGGDKSETFRLEGPPEGTLSLELELDASDQLNQGNSAAEQLGLHPQLAALETMVYPSSSSVLANVALLRTGSLEIIPPEGPLTIFVWGGKRILPVRITSMSITEELHDSQLNPIHAKVSLEMQVLTYNDFPMNHPGYSLFLSHQVVKEATAAVGNVQSASDLSRGKTRII